MSAQSDPESGADWDEGKDGYVEQDRKPRVVAEVQERLQRTR